jgi:hypothetical protein
MNFGGYRQVIVLRETLRSSFRYAILLDSSQNNELFRHGIFLFFIVGENEDCSTLHGWLKL